MAMPLPANFPPPETEGDNEARLAWERARLEEAYDDIANGRVISGQAAIDWLDRWAAGEELDDPSAA
jgi:predicted transcriptional regulator